MYTRTALTSVVLCGFAAAAPAPAVEKEVSRVLGKTKSGRVTKTKAPESAAATKKAAAPKKAAAAKATTKKTTPKKAKA